MTMMSGYHRALCCLQLCRVLEAVATAAPPSSQLAKSSRPQPLLAVWWWLPGTSQMTDWKFKKTSENHGFFHHVLKKIVWGSWFAVPFSETPKYIQIIPDISWLIISPFHLHCIPILPLWELRTSCLSVPIGSSFSSIFGTDFLAPTSPAD